MTELERFWQIETTDATGVNITGERQSPQFATVDVTCLVISDGYNEPSTISIVDQTIVSDSKSSSWKRYPNFTEKPFGNRQTCAE
jgi:hypothetical protein